jgi:predicted GH43/DUF377 family glycosyl hydrolase
LIQSGTVLAPGPFLGGQVTEITSPRPGLWDGKRVGAGGPPIYTDEGWLVIYHGYDDAYVYCMGVALLDRDDLTKVLKRPEPSVLEPQTAWELRGDVPNVVFGCANPVVDGTVYLYYGGAGPGGGTGHSRSRGAARVDARARVA